MNRRAFLATAAGAAAALAGCSGGPSRALPERPTGDWRQHAHDSGNTGATDAAVPSRANPVWDEGEVHDTTPLVDGGTVFSADDEATALDAKTGEERWRTELSGEAAAAPALTDDLLLVATDQRLVGLNRAEGSTEWSKRIPRPATAPLTAAGSLVTVPLAARQGATGIHAYDLATGNRQWTDGTLSARAVAADGDRLFATGYLQDGDTGVLRGLSTDGDRLWERELDHPDSPPVLADGELLVGDAGTLAVHDPANGERLRTLGAFGDPIKEPPAAADGTVFVPDGAGELAAVSVADGTVVWRQDASVTVDTGIAIGAEAVVAAVTDAPDASLPGVAAFERGDGSLRWHHGIEGFDAAASTPPVLADGAVFHVSNDSTGVVALGDLPELE